MTEPHRSVDVAVCAVTHDCADDLDAWLESLGRLDPAPREISVVDCASRDDTVTRLREGAKRTGLALALEPLSDNLGFAGGMNRAIAATDSRWILSLNADARPATDFLERLLAATEAHERIGAVTGRLVRPGSAGPTLLDACGMRLTWSWRHLDRGSEEVDRGQFARREEVFGATGAASLFSRVALEDCALEGQFFDEWFHTFREDAELAFRLQERGWRALYEPAARCEHRRTNVPRRRREMSERINRDTLKNRYLLRAYHQTAGNFLLTSIPTLGRDIAILLWVLLRERSSLGAYRWLWQRRHDILRRRSWLRARRTASPRSIDRWFFRAGRPL